VRNQKPLVPPSLASAVKEGALEQHEICVTLAGTVTEVRIGSDTPDWMAPSKTGARSISTSILAASTPTLGEPWSSRSTYFRVQPLTPPASLNWSTASLPASPMADPMAAMEPVIDSTEPTVISQDCALATVAEPMMRPSPMAVDAIRCFMRFPLSTLYY